MVVQALLALSLAARAAEVRVRVMTKAAPRAAVVEARGARVEVAASGLKAPRRFPGPVRVLVAGAPPRDYPGSLEASRDGDLLKLVVAVDAEEYAAAVAEAEAGTAAPEELLKAQAVAARSWAAAVPPPHDGAFCDLTHCQVYPGRAGGAGRAAAAATQGVLLRREGRVVAGYYHAACGGTLDEPEALWSGAAGRARADAGPGGAAYCALSPQSRWRAEIPAAALERLARAQGWLAEGEPLADLAVADRSPARRALTVAVVGRSRTEVRAERFLSAAGRAFGWSTLKSAAFEVRREGGRFVFEGRGLGHGAGMCQAGAAELARRGASWRDILAHYFPGAAAGGGGCAAGVCLEGDARPGLAELLERERADLPGAPEGVRVVAHADFDSFRKAGGSGRHAARWRGGVLHLAPPGRLAELGRLETVVRHEMSHLWAARVGGPRLPRWLAEGACVWRAGELAGADPGLDEPVLETGGGRISYRDAGRVVARAAERGGLPAVEECLRRRGC